MGQGTFAQVLLGLGLIGLFVLGAIILARLMYAPALPSTLLPTLAIEVAPPGAASLAYFASSSFVVLGAVTLLVGAIAVRTLIEAARGRYFPVVSDLRDDASPCAKGRLDESST